MEKVIELVFEVVDHVRRERLEKTCRVVKAFVKQSGGWRKAFPDKEPAVPPWFLLSKEGSWCMENLRMLSGDAIVLRKAMGIPDPFRTPNRDSAPGIDALCMLLFRFSRTRRYSELRKEFGGSGHRVARITNSLAVYLYNKFRRKLESLDRQRFFICIAHLKEFK